MPKDPKDKGIDIYDGFLPVLYRTITPFATPQQSLDANTWRLICRNQPVIMDCITSLIMYVQGLPWDIRARESDRSDELKKEIDNHKRILLESQDGEGFLTLLDYLLQDHYMIPFGGGLEAVRYDDGELYSIKALDGATLYPYYDPDYPVIQYVPESGLDPVPFAKDELYRIYQFPRPELSRRGWQIAPPEKIYLALELLNRGDRYYAGLLLDTPEAGLLDLGDMSEDSAKKWLESFKALFSGIDGFKIPVIYQHTTPAKYIPFNRPPGELLFDSITLKYAQLATAGFGMTTGDIGLKGSNGSLSSDIRDERNSKSTGKASVKKHIEELINKILPKYLQFWFIDVDDELMVSKGRARSTNGVAMRNLVEGGILTPEEARAQLKADGLITIPLTDKVNPADFNILKEINGTADEMALKEKELALQEKQMNSSPGGINKPGGQAGFSLNSKRNVRGGKLEAVQGKDPKPASSGGQGEVKSAIEENEFRDILVSGFAEIRSKISLPRIRKLIRSALPEIRSYYSEDNSELYKTLESKFKDMWWDISLDDTEIGDVLSRSYSKGLEDTAKKIEEYLYENDFEDTLDLEDLIGKFELKSETAKSDLYKIGSQLNQNINNVTKNTISRLLVESIQESLSYVDGEDEEIVSRATTHFINKFTSILDQRIDLIDRLEKTNSYNMGAIRQYKSCGIEDLPYITESSELHSGDFISEIELVLNDKLKSTYYFGD